MADAVTQLACSVAGMPDAPRKARTSQTCSTADAEQLEHTSGEMMVSMNQQQEITIKTMEKTMQMGLKEVSKFPDHLGPMLEGLCGLRAVLPHPERISDPKVQEHFRAAHRELGEEQGVFASDPSRHLQRDDDGNWDSDPKTAPNLSI